MTTAEPLYQQILQANKEILVRIINELGSDEFRILATSAWFADVCTWFTTEELFHIVNSEAVQKVKTGSENQENLIPDFRASSFYCETSVLK